jgi:hypothetical protein
MSSSTYIGAYTTMFYSVYTSRFKHTCFFCAQFNAERNWAPICAAVLFFRLTSMRWKPDYKHWNGKKFRAMAQQCQMIHRDIHATHHSIRGVDEVDAIGIGVPNGTRRKRYKAM